MTSCRRRWRHDVVGDVIPLSVTSAAMLLLRGVVSAAVVCLAGACILLLDGWRPKSVAQRTRLADIVVVAHAQRVFKSARTPDAHTYSAEFRFVSVLKGAAELATVAADDDGGRVYNVSNFGDRAKCYAEVERRATYVLFLTVFERRLSAKYDDIFGAVADYYEDTEREVLEALGE